MRHFLRMTTRLHLLAVVFLLVGGLPAGLSGASLAVDPGPSAPVSLLNEVRHALTLAGDYLLDTQAENGSWKDDPAITALALYSLLSFPTYSPGARGHAAITSGLGYLEGFVQADGGIYRKEYRNYTTAVCLLAFTASDRDTYLPIVRNAKRFLVRFQVDEDEGVTSDHPFYGGIGYGGDTRPDLSNTQLALEAIRSAEQFEARYRALIPDNDQMDREEAEMGLHWRKALVFLARCQSLTSVNDKVDVSDDGGFIYETGKYKADRSHSYGSMTYAGVKSLLYARVDRNDVRVRRATEWIRHNFTFDENPGFGAVSLYYYYMTAAKCLDTLGEDPFIDAAGRPRHWRIELIEKLLSQQHEEGYWVNADGRYWENIKTLATAYAVIAMKYAVQGIIDPDGNQNTATAVLVSPAGSV